ncbi:MAG TPA: hypothetical protein VGL08_15620 [Paraburkholderia sp.]|jgi:hypothetical protein
MDLTNWIIMLAIALVAVAFFCTRAPANWSMENRARRVTGTRLLAQAVLALWTALLGVLHGLGAQAPPQVGSHPGSHHAPAVLIGAAILVAFGCYWLIRGSKMLKPRRLFTAY